VWRSTKRCRTIRFGFGWYSVVARARANKPRGPGQVAIIILSAIKFKAPAKTLGGFFHVPINGSPHWLYNFENCLVFKISNVGFEKSPNFKFGKLPNFQISNMKSHRNSNLKNYRIFKIPNFNFHYGKEELDYEKADKSTFQGALRIKL
jgi:hypothetical protein